jgi:hypothetical protein
MTVIEYAEFLGVTLVFMLIVLRACYFLFSLKSDPIKAINPFPSIITKYLKRKELDKVMDERKQYS